MACTFFSSPLGILSLHCTLLNIIFNVNCSALWNKLSFWTTMCISVQENYSEAPGKLCLRFQSPLRNYVLDYILSIVDFAQYSITNCDCSAILPLPWLPAHSPKPKAHTLCMASITGSNKLTLIILRRV